MRAAGTAGGEASPGAPRSAPGFPLASPLSYSVSAYGWGGTGGTGWRGEGKAEML